MDMPAQQPGIWDALQMRLRALHGMHEVAVGRSIGPFVRISLKGTAEALYEAQKRLGRTLGLDLGKPGTTSKATPAHRPQQLEAPTTRAYIPVQPSLTPPQSPRAGGTPVNPDDSTKPVASPICSSPCLTTAAPQSNKRRTGISQEEWTAKRSTELTAPTDNEDTSLKRQGVQLGVMDRKVKTYGFIRCDDGSQTFVIPSACAKFGYKLPPIGTRLMFKIVTDSKTGQTRADACSQATETDDKGIRSHADKTEPFSWKLGDERRGAQAQAGIPDWLTIAKKAESPPQRDTNDNIQHVARIRGNRKGSPTPSLATSSDYVDKAKDDVEAAPTTTTVPGATETPPQSESYVVDYKGASLRQIHTRSQDQVPGSSEHTATPNYLPLRPTFGIHLHSRTCGLPVGANPQYYQPDI